jgi:hypothetical protein
MHLCRREKSQVTILPLRTYASLTRAHHISHFVQATTLPSHFERQRGSSYGQGIQLSSAFALVVRHGPALWG